MYLLVVLSHALPQGYTPLMLAAMFGCVRSNSSACDPVFQRSTSPSLRHAHIVRTLLKRGANVNLQSTDKETAADVAKGMVLANEIRNYKPGN